MEEKFQHMLEYVAKAIDRHGNDEKVRMMITIQARNRASRGEILQKRRLDQTGKSPSAFPALRYYRIYLYA